MSRMPTNNFINCGMTLDCLGLIIGILKRKDNTSCCHSLADDAMNWIEVDDFRKVMLLYGGNISLCETLSLLQNADKRIVFLFFTLIHRYLYYNTKRIQQLFIEHYESLCAEPDCTDQETIQAGKAYEQINNFIDECKDELFAEHHTMLFALDNDELDFGSQIPMRPDFAINVGVEKSRITTLKRQAVLKAEREAKAKEDEALIKALEEAKPEKQSKKSQTKSANKKKEQEKKEREEYEKRSALAEAERQRQLKKKQEQKKAKKVK
jgi:hypothetical protein